MKGLEQEITQSHFIKFEFSPTMHFALNSSQPVLYIFRLSAVTRDCIFSERVIFCA